MKTATYTITGTTPLIHHNERLANPFDPLTQELKALTKRRNKTLDDLREMSRIEWLGGLYFDEGLSAPIVPGYNIFAALIGAGRLQKLGASIKRSALVKEDVVPVEYDGPRSIDELFADKRFVDLRNVKVGTSKVLRCRPIFKQWALKFTVLYEESGLDRSQLDRVVSDAGSMVGLGDYRPRFGRFEITKAS